MKSKISVYLLGLSLVLVLVVGAVWLLLGEPGSPRFALAAPNASQVDWWTGDAGGGESSGPTYLLQGTLGQPDAAPAGGWMGGGSFQLQGGFWHAPAETDFPLFLPVILR